MSEEPETEAEIQQEMRELGIDNESTGSPDVMMSGNVVRVIAALLAVLMLAGAVLLVF
jgi:hypothetical protein